jgi:hypothetical protein
MTQISFDAQPLGVASVDTEGTYVGGPLAFGAFPAMMRRKFIGETAQKVVRLADIYRMPRICRPGFAEDVDARDGEKDGPDRVQIESVFRPA